MSTPNYMSRAINLHVIPSLAISCILQHAETILMDSWSTKRIRQSVPPPAPEAFLLDLMTSCIISELMKSKILSWDTFFIRNKNSNKQQIQ